MNYVLLFPDEMRAESLGCYGHPLVKTPYIDRLAQEGTLFEQNYTTHPVCGPSRCNLVSGWDPPVNGKSQWLGSACKWKKNVL
ncbi:putative Sulfatase [Firmicutes bacterium CAG:212]|nr:putative Sulfatase [Firmicutes bacterium CAG:212]